MKKIIGLLIGTVLTLNILIFSMSTADDCNEGIFKAKPVTADNIIATSKKPAVSAMAAIVVDMESGRVLYEKNAYSKRAIASTTKIMTAIVALENGNPDDVVTVSKRAANTWGSSIDLIEGEKLSLKELLYGLMLNSGNDAAIAIAEHIGGSVESFADMMNEKARELGADNTHFVTPHGLDIQDHYSTAYDLALISRYALTNPVFASIVSTKTMSIKGRQLYNTNEMLGVYPGADGVKTGYTGQAGRCLVTSSTRDKWKIISVVLGCSTRTQRAAGSQAILDYSYQTYKICDLQKEKDRIKDISIVKGIKNNMPVLVLSSIRYPLKSEEIGLVKTEISLPNSLKAPVIKGTEIGEIRFMLNDNIIASSKLISGESVRRKVFADYLGDIFTAWGRLIKNN